MNQPTNGWTCCGAPQNGPVNLWTLLVIKTNAFFSGGFLLTHREDFKFQMKQLKEAVKRKEIGAYGKNNPFWFGAFKVWDVAGSGPWIYRVGNQNNIALLVFYFWDRDQYFKRIAPVDSLFPFICRGEYQS